MKRVLILGYLSDGVERLYRERVRMADYRLVSISPEVSEFLRQCRLSHASILEYVEFADWEAIHEEIGRALRELSASVAAPFGAEWLDDWSHLIVDEARELFLWSRAAKRILDVEQPSAVLLQEPAESRSSHRALCTIALACRLLGRNVETWP
jgi:hypothetical protein